MCHLQARGDRTTPERAASTARQLEGLLRQLDGLLPYLGVTISSVGLLDAGGATGHAPESVRESCGSDVFSVAPGRGCWRCVTLWGWWVLMSGACATCLWMCTRGPHCMLQRTCAE